MLLKKMCLKTVKKIIAIDSSGLVKKTDYGNNITENQGEIPCITDLVTTAALNLVKYEITQHE